MGNIGDSMAPFPIPIVGSSGTTYATQIDAFLNEVLTRLSQKVPLSSISPGQLDFGNNPAINLQYAGLYPQTSTPTTPAGTLQSYQGNLYWISNSGAVQITTGTTLNAAALAGLTGDYGGSNPAQLRFVNADNRYYFYQDFGNNKWSAALAQFFDLSAVATGANPTYIRLSAAGAGSTYTLILPTGVPGTQAVLQMAGSGQMSASNTLVNAITAPNYHFTSPVTLMIPAAAADGVSNTRVSGGGGIVSALTYWRLSTLAAVTYPILGLLPNDTITGYTLNINKTSGAGETISAQIVNISNTGTAAVGSPGVQNSANTPGQVNLTESGLSISPSANLMPVFAVQSNTGTATTDVWNLTVTVTR